MHSDDIWRQIDQQRDDLADLLDGVDGSLSSTPSLCDGWTVRDVGAHVTQSQLGATRLAIEMARSGFRFNAMVHRTAVQDNRSLKDIATALRAMRGSRRHPPGTTERDPLVDVLVHGQDIAVPLGIDRPMPTEAAVVAADRLWTMGFPYNARRGLRGIRLVADDAPFAVGEGTTIAAPVRDIVMVLSGRHAPVSAAIAEARAG